MGPEKPNPGVGVFGDRSLPGHWARRRFLANSPKEMGPCLSTDRPLSLVNTL